MTLVKWVIIRAGDALSPVPRKATTSTNDELKSTESKRGKSSEIWKSYFHFSYDDVIKWRHFPPWPFVRVIHLSPVDSPHKGQWRGALMFPLICTRTNGWTNNWDAGDLRRHRTHHGATLTYHENVLEMSPTNQLPFASCALCYMQIYQTRRADTYQFKHHGMWLSLKHIEAETKWTPFRRRHFQMHFLEWKCMNFE